ncbi:2-phosphosulfolactate phosphatase [Peribacillus asahii]|uniref:Probable 2-phosphosulfolactate phosphatase n=1 Tax=Peribacillus asahii TaxID=228899 RepID=A0A398BB32_9BACI|nr:2-phosphosulfolactate phosphatase [Peribacillus asahii]RID87027.1 2-phosphosulfolactate phosphatase [Peribacillus asahii]
MTKIHLLMKKEEIDCTKMSDNKIAVVFDVLLATSTITSALYHGAKEVIPVLNAEQALLEANKRKDDSCILAGEYEGKVIDGFLGPHPLQLQSSLFQKSLILSTTNGTVAIRKSSAAKKVYICSLLNGQAVANRLAATLHDETIIVVCSGSSNEFCLEDFYGAGYFLYELLQQKQMKWELSDAAQAALAFYTHSPKNGPSLLNQSRVGKLLKQYGLQDEINFVASEGMIPTVPVLTNNFRVIAEEQHIVK